MRRWTWCPLVAAMLLGCGGQSSPAKPDLHGNNDPVVPGDSVTDPKPDPAPILPIPDDAPGADPEAASKVPIKPIPDEQ